MLFFIYLVYILCYYVLEVKLVHPYFETKNSKIYISHHKESYSFDSHFQNKIEVAYCFTGMQKVKLGETLYTLRSGDCIIIFPNIVHEYIKSSPKEDIETETLSLISDTDFFDSLLPDIVTKRPVSPFIESQKIDTDTAHAFSKMVKARDNNIELLGWSCIALSGIINVVDLVPFKETGCPSLAPSIISYINVNFKKDLNIKLIASEFGYSPSYIAHIFHDSLKIPFRTYLGSVRSEYAKELILKGNKSLTEISYECGYNSINTFCRSFKKHFGQVPSEFKKNAKHL